MMDSDDKTIAIIFVVLFGAPSAAAAAYFFATAPVRVECAKQRCDWRDGACRCEGHK